MDNRQVEYKEKTFADITGNRNGMVLNMSIDNKYIGMPEEVQTMDLEHYAGEKMRRGAEPKIFDNNGGYSKGDGGGVINKNGTYGPITFGF